MCHRIRFAGSFFALVVALAATRSGSADPVPAQSPARLATQSPAPSSAPSPAPSTALDSLLAAPTLELDLLERAVLQRNPSLGAMRAAWRAAQAAADQAGALDDPMLDFSTAPRSWSGNAVDRAYMVGISQHFPIFGQRGLKGRSARAGARAMGEDYRTARLDLVREARRAYYAYYLATRSQAVNTDLKDLLAQFRRIAVAKYSAGTTGLDDALQAEVELAMLNHQEIVLKRDRRVVLAEVNALLRREPTHALPEPPAELPAAAAPVRGDSLRVVALELRPELKGWAAQREAREADLSLARRQRLPDFTFMARYDRFMNEREWRPQVGLGLNLPIQLGRIEAAVREARAGLEQADYRRKAAEVQIGFEVESALAQVQETGHEVHVLEEGVVPATERALQAVRASYENNRSDFLALLNAERDLARARLELYSAKVGYLQALADLDRAVGVAPIEASREVE